MRDLSSISILPAQIKKTSNSHCSQQHSISASMCHCCSFRNLGYFRGHLGLILKAVYDK